MKFLTLRTEVSVVSMVEPDATCVDDFRGCFFGGDTFCCRRGNLFRLRKVRDAFRKGGDEGLSS